MWLKPGPNFILIFAMILAGSAPAHAEISAKCLAPLSPSLASIARGGSAGGLTRLWERVTGQLPFYHYVEPDLVDFFQKWPEIFRAFTGEKGAESFLIAAAETGRTRKLPRSADLKALSTEETRAIRYYTSSEYALNDFIRDGKFDDLTPRRRTVREEMNVLTAALEKLPDYEGVTFRGINFGQPDNIPKELLTAGNTFTDVGYLSTSRKSASAYVRELDRYQSGVFMVILGRHGKSVEAISRYKNEEKEILYAPNTKFRVETSIRLRSGVLPTLNNEASLFVFLREI